MHSDLMASVKGTGFHTAEPYSNLDVINVKCSCPEKKKITLHSELNPTA